jgi:hypothetical protein
VFRTAAGVHFIAENKLDSPKVRLALPSALLLRSVHVQATKLQKLLSPYLNRFDFSRYFYVFDAEAGEPLLVALRDRHTLCLLGSEVVRSHSKEMGLPQVDEE